MTAKAHEHYRHAAVMCREGRWEAAALLVGPVAGSPFDTPDAGSAVAIVVTAIGRTVVLGVHVADRRGGRWFLKSDMHERSWAVLHHSFRPATSAEAAAVREAVGPRHFDRLTGGGEP